MHRNRSAKILATSARPASGPERVRALHEAGADAFRLNFSHGTHEQHAERYRTIRDVEAALGRPIGIVADLQGPKLRIGRFGRAGSSWRRARHFGWISTRPRRPQPHQSAASGSLCGAAARH